MADLIYNRFYANLFKKQIDWMGDTIKLALVQASYTPDKDHNTWSTVSTYEAVGTGYTAGGIQLAGVTVQQVDASDQVRADANDVTWASVTVSARYAVVYDDTLGTKDLIACFDMGTTKSASGAAFTVEFNALGLFIATQV